MKKVYVVVVSWTEDGKWYTTNLHAFSNRKAAQGYCNHKNEHRSIEQIADRSTYKIEELNVWSKNFLKKD